MCVRRHSLGPLVLATTEQSDACAKSRCSGRGTCWCSKGGGGDAVCSPADACDCDDGYKGKDCSEQV